jgi:hypothetical protein
MTHEMIEQVEDDMLASELSDEALDRAEGRACYCWANAKGPTPDRE